MRGPYEIRRLLEDLRGGGFKVRISLLGGELIGQKVVAVVDGILYTVDAAGNVRATLIDQIQSVDF